MHSQEKKGTCTAIHKELVTKLVRLPADSRLRGNDGVKKGYQSGAALRDDGTPKPLDTAPLMYFLADSVIPADAGISLRVASNINQLLPDLWNIQLLLLKITIP